MVTSFATPSEGCVRAASADVDAPIANTTVNTQTRRAHLSNTPTTLRGSDAC